jgi:hypothetical protein
MHEFMDLALWSDADMSSIMVIKVVKVYVTVMMVVAISQPTEGRTFNLQKEEKT